MRFFSVSLLNRCTTFATEGDVDLITIVEAVLVLVGQIDGGQDDDGILAVDVDVHMDGAAHQLGDVHAGVNGMGRRGIAEDDVGQAGCPGLMGWGCTLPAFSLACLSSGRSMRTPQVLT